MKISLEDKDAIRELVARYDLAIDLGDYEAYANTFTVDGTFWVDGFGEGSIVAGRHTGRPALFNFAKLNYEAYQGHLRHWNNGVQLIEGAGNRARMTSYMIGITVGMLGTAHILETGVYYDRLCKIDGDWFFEERHFIADPQYQHRGLTWDAQSFSAQISGERDV
jgi:SnoaL-like protein